MWVNFIIAGPGADEVAEKFAFAGILAFGDCFIDQIVELRSKGNIDDGAHIITVIQKVGFVKGRVTPRIIRHTSEESLLRRASSEE